MHKARHIVLVTLVAFIIAARVNVSVGEWYAANLYPIISAGLSFLVSWIPFSMTEVLAVCAIGLIICLLAKGIRNKDKVWKIVRESIYSRGNIERQPFDEKVFNKFLSDYADSLNYAYTQDSVDLPAFEDDIKSIYTSVPDSFGLCEPKNWQHPKQLLFNRLYTSVGVGGYIGPFFCETHINADLLPAQRPYSYAHELSHLLGVSNEDEIQRILFSASICAF